MVGGVKMATVLEYSSAYACMYVCMLRTDRPTMTMHAPNDAPEDENTVEYLLLLIACM